MQPSDFSLLADVAALAGLDLSPKPLTLRVVGDKLFAIYAGTYIRGEAAVVIDTTVDRSLFPRCVEAKQFAGVEAILGSDSPILIQQDTRGQFYIGNGKVKLTLARHNEEPEEVCGGPTTVLFTASRNDLKSEVELASDFCAKTTQKPLLTGVRLVPSMTGVGIIACDGYSGLYMTSVPAVCSDVKFDITVPGYDVAAGLKVLNGEQVTGGYYRSESGNYRLALACGDTVFHCTPLQGQWPSLRELAAPVERDEVLVNSDTLRAAAASVKMMVSDNHIILEGAEGMTYLRTSDSEHGRFETVVDGGLPTGQRAIFDVAHLALAGKMGGELRLNVARERMKSTYVESGRRRYWIAQRVG